MKRKRKSLNPYQQGGTPQFVPQYQFQSGMTPNASDSARYLKTFNKGYQVMTGPQRPWVEKKYGNEVVPRMNMGFNRIDKAAYRDLTQQAIAAGVLRPMKNGSSLNPYQDGGAMAQEVQPQEDPMAALITQVQQALQQGVEPQQILQQLVKMGMSQDEATQLIQSVMQQSQQASTMRRGGRY